MKKEFTGPLAVSQKLRNTNAENRTYVLSNMRLGGRQSWLGWFWE
jgi:hypothetical protein